MDQARNTFLSGGGMHRVIIDLPPDLPRVMADQRRIVQVLNNLFSNAAKHSAGSSPLRVAALRDGVQVAISVSDEGRGVPPERLPHLFSKYGGTGDGDREPRPRGFGLGLSICKGLVEAHGGRIWAESCGAGRGTRFNLHTPGGGRGPPLPAPPGLVRARRGNGATRNAYSWSTTTRRRCVTFGTRSRRRATPRS